MLENLRTKFTKKNRSEIHARKVTYKISLIFPVRIMTKNLSTKNLPNFYYQNFYANKKPKEKKPYTLYGEQGKLCRTKCGTGG